MLRRSPLLPRPRRRCSVLFGLLLVAADRLAAQAPPAKKVLTFADYDVWRTAAERR